MPIYSKNRSGLITEGKTGFGMNDTGRALYESCINDRAIFNAMIKHDMNEIKGLKEGTILESEVQSLNEASAKEFIGRIIDKLEILWRKLKDIFKDAMNKIVSFVTGDGKKFVKKFNEFKGEYSDSKVTINGKFPDSTNIFEKCKVDKVAYDIMADKYQGKEKSEIVAASLGEYLGVGKSLTPDEFRTWFKETGFKHRDGIGLNDTIVTVMCNILSSGETVIKNIKKAQKDCERYIGDLKKMLKSSKVADAINPAINKKEEIDTANINKLAGIAESVASLICHTSIAHERERVSVSRKALGALMAAVKAGNKDQVQHNSAVLTAIVEASIELDDAFDGATEEVSDEVNELIASVE